MKLTSRALGVLVPMVFLVGIGGTAALNLWQTESDKVPARISRGEFEGEFDPGDIRGSYSFADVESAFEIPAAVIAAAFGFEGVEDSGAIQAKDLEETYGEIDNREIGTDSLRLFVALWRGLPYKPEETTALPNQALSALRDAGKIDDERLAELRSTIGIRTPATGEASVEEHVDDPEDTTVKGRTTFDEVLGWGLSREQIEEAIGTEMGPRAMTIRDYLSEKGIEFKDARDALQALIDG